MSYRVIFDPGATRELAKLPKAQQQQTIDLISSLSENPRPMGSKKLVDIDAYKIRAGDYRVIYSVKDVKLIVLVLKVGNRRDVYKDIGTIRKRLKK